MHHIIIDRIYIHLLFQIYLIYVLRLYSSIALLLKLRLDLQKLLEKFNNLPKMKQYMLLLTKACVNVLREFILPERNLKPLVIMMF